jgi:phage shock protein C
MNRIITANINSFVFPIDEAAYENLKTYLNTIRLKVGNEEVVADIENRIAELFDYKLKNGRPAIFLDDVQDIMGQIGNPDQFGNDDMPEEPIKTATAENGKRRSYRRLYRNDDDKMLGGVCGGLGAYFDVNPMIPRILFILSVFVGGLGLVLYILLVVVIPKAITPSEKLEMRGEPVDYRNLSKSVEGDIREAYERYRPEMRTGFERFISFAVKAGAIVFMIFLVSIFVPVCIGILMSIGIASWSLPVLSSYMFTSYDESLLILAGLILFLLIPVFAIGYAIIRMIFKTRPMGKIISLPLIVLWITGFCLLAYSTFNIGKQFSTSYNVSSQDTLTGAANKTLIIRARQSQRNSEFIIRNEEGVHHMNIHSRQDMREALDEEISSNVELRIIKGLTEKPLLSITRRSAGTDLNNARENARNIAYNYTSRDSVLYLDDFFSLGNQKLWRNQKLLVTVEVPEGYKLYIDPSCHRMFESTHFTRHFNYNDHDEITGKYLRIDGRGINVPVE